MAKYTAFRIDTITLEKLRSISKVQERSMAGQVRFWVEREYQLLKTSERLAAAENDNGKENNES